jgi:predicted ATPase/class 3 adenylate cyclase
MNERLDPEEVRGIVGQIKAEAVRIVEGHGGIVNQFVGDEVVALFGIPAAHEDDPVRAVRAAREIHALVRGLSPNVEGKIGAPLRLHTGISTGLIVTSTEDRRDGTFGITGDTVNTGARLASKAEADTILVSEETQRLIADYFQTEALTPVKWKGKAGRVTPYRIIEQTRVSSRFQAAEQRGFTRYVGREAELRALYRALERTRSGRGQFVTVMGEPGIGKSRLLFEFRHGLPRDQITVLTGHCQSYGTDTPYLPMIDALRRGLRLEAAPGPDALHDHAVRAVRAISPELERFLPHYLHLLSIPSETHKLPASLQGDALRRAFEDALAAILTLNARRLPMVLMLEDWHWADEASDAALRHLAGLIPYHLLLVVVTYRPDYERKWSNVENYTPLVLRPLGEAETETMLRSVWKAEDLPAGLAAQVHARTGGNALFNEEVARGLTESDLVRVDGRRATLTGDLAQLNLPDSVHAVIRARVDRLDPESREVLRLASVIGREFTRPLLERLYPNPSRLHGALETLATQDLIHPVRVVPEPAFLFKHALVQDVVYETLLLSQRKELHEQVGAAIEALYADRLEEQYEALAGHYSKSDNTEKAVEFLEKAGDKASKLYSLEDARTAFRRAIALLLSGENRSRNLRLHVELGAKFAAAAMLESSPEVLAVIESSLRSAETTADDALIAKATYWMARMQFIMGNVDESGAFAQRCLNLAQNLADERLTAFGHNILGRLCLWKGECTKGIEQLEKAIPLADRAGIAAESFHSTTYIAAMHALTGNFPLAAAIRKRTYEAASKMGNLTMEAMATMMAICETWPLAEWAEAEASMAKVGHMAQRIGLPLFVMLSRCYEAYYDFYLGRGMQAVQSLKIALLRLESSGCNFGRVLNHAMLADSSAVAGLAESARDSAERSMEGTKLGQGFGLEVAHCARALATAQTIPADWQGAEADIQRALGICEVSGKRPYTAITHFRYAEILHKKGDLDRALAQLAEAEKLFAEMEMTWWSGQAAGLRARIEGGKPFVWFAPYVDGPPKLDG